MAIVLVVSMRRVASFFCKWCGFDSDSCTQCISIVNNRHRCVEVHGSSVYSVAKVKEVESADFSRKLIRGAGQEERFGCGMVQNNWKMKASTRSKWLSSEN
eukprot:4473092-Amphidinium_carterae.1